MPPDQYIKKLLMILIPWALFVAFLIVAMVTAEAANVTDAPLYTCSYRPIGIHRITGYVPTDPRQTGKEPDDPWLGIGANCTRIIPGRHVAMKGMPFGTRIYIHGLGEYEVQDRGVGPGIVDVACSTNAECRAITGHYPVYIIK